MDNKNFIFVSITIIIFLLIVVYSTNKRTDKFNAIKQSPLIRKALIFDSKNIVKGSRLKVRYFYNNIYYTTEFYKPRVYCKIVSEIVPIIIDSLNPVNSQILLFPSDFLEFNLNYPDSLNWTKACFKLD